MLIRTIRIYCQDIGTEFRIAKCGMLIIKSEKRETTEEIEPPNQGEKENYKYLEILEKDTIKSGTQTKDKKIDDDKRSLTS